MVVIAGRQGRGGIVNDVHHWATHPVCGLWPDIHRSEAVEGQPYCSGAVVINLSQGYHK